MTEKTYYLLHPGLWSRTQISGSGSASNSRHLNFLGPALVPTSKRFCLQLLPRMMWFIENWKPLYYLYNFLDPQARAVKPEPKFQAPPRVPPPKSFWLRLKPSKIASAPGSGSTALFQLMHSVWQKKTAVIGGRKDPWFDS